MTPDSGYFLGHPVYGVTEMSNRLIYQIAFGGRAPPGHLAAIRGPTSMARKTEGRKMEDEEQERERRGRRAEGEGRERKSWCPMTFFARRPGSGRFDRSYNKCFPCKFFTEGKFALLTLKYKFMDNLKWIYGENVHNQLLFAKRRVKYPDREYFRRSNRRL